MLKFWVKPVMLELPVINTEGQKGGFNLDATDFS
jgi:hypothetical protein